MKRARSLVIVSFCLAGTALQVRAYEIPTHRDLTAVAVDRSMLALDPTTLQNLGLNKGVRDQTQQFPNSMGSQGSILDLLQDGADFEDSLFPTIRVLRHFYNPLTGEGLNIPAFPTQMSSPDWALARPGTESAQERSYWNARQSLFDALTKPTEVERQAAFGETFQFLGQVVHHLQDMAQPQHVRNDVHCDWWFPCAAFDAHAPSLYESWTNQRQVRTNLPTDFSSIGYSITSSTFTSTFNSPRRFWHTEPPGPNSPAEGKGMAEFTNRNFVSAGTNFDKPGLFPTPDFNSATSTSIDIQQLCTGAQPACINPNLTGPVVFFGNTVVDLYTGSVQSNPRASTLSVFDPDLQKAGKPFTFTLNRFNFSAAHSFLIPRAVAYSAGMINYFFRGKIDLVPDDANPGTFLIKNLGNEPMSGTFALYYDDAGNNRTLLISWDRSIPANDQVNIGTIPPDPTNPAPKNPGVYMLVFKGDMGAETTAEFGAVVGKVVTIAPWTFTDIGPIYVFSPFFCPGLGINNAGQVVGTTTDNAQAFLWSSGSGMQLLPGGVLSFACGINSSGLIVGVVDGGEAALWSGTTGVQRLGTLLNSNQSRAFAINSSGQVVGTSILFDPEGVRRAFLWSPGSGMQGLGTPGFTGSEAFGINSSGQVVGYSDSNGGIRRAFLWSPGPGMQDLGALPGGTSSVASGINDIGQVVGYSDSNGGIRRAFLWSPGSGMQDLGTLPGFTESEAFGINGSGQVVGQSYASGLSSQAFLWSSVSGMQSLSALVHFILTRSGMVDDWGQIIPSAINDAGQIVGWGQSISGRGPHAFLLSPTRRP